MIIMRIKGGLGNPFNHMKVIFKKSAVLSAGNYQPFHSLEDWYLWAHLAPQGYLMGNLPNVVLDARVDCAMYSRRGGWKYFKNNFALSQKLRELKLISLPTCILDICIRFCVQVLLPHVVCGCFCRRDLR